MIILSVLCFQGEVMGAKGGRSEMVENEMIQTIRTILLVCGITFLGLTLIANVARAAEPEITVEFSSN